MENGKTQIVIAVITGSLFVLLFVIMMFLVIFVYLKRKKRIIHEKKVREAQIQQEVLQAQLEMQEHTLRSISQEIHDNVGQILSLAKVNLSILTMENNGNNKLEVISGLVGKAIRELRDLSTGYYADRLVEGGLCFAIQHELEQLERTGLFQTRFRQEADIPLLSKSKIIFLYRIIQEVFNNIIKHAKATSVEVYIGKSGSQIHIQVHDNGKGFDVDNATTSAQGIGLKSMRHRAGMIEASLNIESIIDQGTQVDIFFKEDAL